MDGISCFKVSICFRGLNDMCRALAPDRYVPCMCVCVYDVASKVVVVMLMTMAKWTQNPSATTRIWHNQDKFAVVKMWRQWKMDQHSVGRRRSDESVCVHCQSYLRPARLRVCQHRYAKTKTMEINLDILIKVRRPCNVAIWWLYYTKRQVAPSFRTI